jgi:hypothetical protein
MLRKTLEYSAGFTFTKKDRDEVMKAYAQLTEKQLKINANEDAHDTIPEGDDKIPSGSKTEHAIVSAFTQTEKDIEGKMESAVNDCQSKMKTNFIIHKVDDVSENEIKRKMNSQYSLVAQQDEDANTIARNYMETSKDLRKFKHTHERDASANYPEIYMRPIAVLAALFLGETLINGAVFKDLSGGFLGGIFLAAFFAFINVLLAMITGSFGWKNIIYKNIKDSKQKNLRKLLGVIVTLVGTLLAFVWNLGVAHYREVATSDTFGELTDTGRLAIQHLMEHPFGLGQLEAYALWIFGLIIFIFVAKDFYSGFDDPFPGYGAITRKQKKAEMAWHGFKLDREHELRDYFDELKGSSWLEDGEPQGYKAHIEEESEKRRDAKNMLNNLLSHKQDLESSLVDSLNVARGKLGFYRDEYLKITGANGRRNHFNVGLEFSNNLDSVFDIEEIEALVEEIETNYQHNKKVYENAIIVVDEQIQPYIEKLNQTKKDGASEDGFFEQLLRSNDKHIKGD